MDDSVKISSSTKKQEYPSNFEGLAIKLILDNPELKKLREQLLEKSFEIELRNLKIKLKEMKKLEQGEEESEPVKESY